MAAAAAAATTRIQIRIGSRFVTAPAQTFPFVMHIGLHMYECTPAGEIQWTGAANRPASGVGARLLPPSGQPNIEIAFEAGTEDIEVHGFDVVVNRDSGVLAFHRRAQQPQQQQQQQQLA